MSNAREQFIDTACTLVEEQGYHATGVNQIINESGAPKGSLYYYFPDGKEGLIAEAIETAGKRVAERITANLARIDDPVEALRQFLYGIAAAVEESGYRSGGPLTTVAMETATTSERLNEVCREGYQRLQDAFKAKLVSSGMAEPRAGEIAMFITASIEGGIILSRTYHSGDPLRRAADELATYLTAQVAAE